MGPGFARWERFAVGPAPAGETLASPGWDRFAAGPGFARWERFAVGRAVWLVLWFGCNFIESANLHRAKRGPNAQRSHRVAVSPAKGPTAKRPDRFHP